MCGIVGIVGTSPVNQRLYDALTVLQHRGQDAAGIATAAGGALSIRKGSGLVRDTFQQHDMLELRGDMGIGHVRYPTAGADGATEAQPFYVNAPYGICLALNGTAATLENIIPQREPGESAVDDFDRPVVVCTDVISRGAYLRRTVRELWDLGFTRVSIATLIDGRDLKYASERPGILGVRGRDIPLVSLALASLDRLRKGGLVRSAAERVFAADWAVRLNLKYGRLTDPVFQLSGGNQQKVVLAKWLGRGPGVLIVDEPTRGIDVATKAEVHHLLLRLARDGVAVLMISSELPEVLRISDRILVMREGRLAGEYSRAEASEEQIMSAATGQLAGG